MALVLGPIAFSIEGISILNVLGSTSTNTGVSPSSEITSTVAAKVKEALEADGSSFVSANPTRLIEAKTDGTLTVTYELTEGDVSVSALNVSSIGSSDLTSTFATLRNGLQELSIGSASTTPLGIVSEINSSAATLGINAQLINDGSGSANPYNILLLISDILYNTSSEVNPESLTIIELAIGNFCCFLFNLTMYS